MAKKATPAKRAKKQGADQEPPEPKAKPRAKPKRSAVTKPKPSETAAEKKARIKATNLKNLRKGMFKKGQSGNPKGRPKGALNLTASLVAAFRETVKGDKSGRTYADQLIERMRQVMIQNPVRARHLIARLQDRDEGPIKHEISVEGTGTLTGIVVCAEGGSDEDEGEDEAD